MRIFNAPFDVGAALERTRARGYLFCAGAIDPDVCRRMEREVAGLLLEDGDHETHPINKGDRNEVRQRHERAYRPLGHPDAPVGTAVCQALAREIAPFAARHPELDGWIPNEIGYQRYRDGRDRISPHRDRASDRLLSVTITIAGSAWMRIHEAETDPPDYARLRVVDEFFTEAGTAMFLRAPGFGSGAQIIHEVLPPIGGPRLILNLRMRPTILRPPKETKWR